MRYAIIAHDRPTALQIRLDNRAAHLNYVETTGVVEEAGPFLDGAGQMCGSLLILKVDTMQAAQDWAAGDPYAQADLFQTVSIQPWKKVIG